METMEAREGGATKTLLFQVYIQDQGEGGAM